MCRYLRQSTIYRCSLAARDTRTGDPPRLRSKALCKDGGKTAFADFAARQRIGLEQRGRHNRDPESSLLLGKVSYLVTRPKHLRYLFPLMHVTRRTGLSKCREVLPRLRN